MPQAWQGPEPSQDPPPMIPRRDRRLVPAPEHGRTPVLRTGWAWSTRHRSPPGMMHYWGGGRGREGSSTSWRTPRTVTYVSPFPSVTPGLVSTTSTRRKSFRFRIRRHVGREGEGGGVVRIIGRGAGGRDSARGSIGPSIIALGRRPRAPSSRTATRAPSPAAAPEDESARSRPGMTPPEPRPDPASPPRLALSPGGASCSSPIPCIRPRPHHSRRA